MALKSLVRKFGLEKQVKTLMIRGGKLGEDFLHLYQKPDPTTSILLVGSGRSGTTWLGDLITSSMRGVQQIFEPLYPVASAEVRRLTGFDERDPYVRSFYLRPHESHPEWENLWYRILSGAFRNYWTDYHKRWYFFANMYLIKEIRANLMLGFIAAKVSPKIVFLIRHPCGVIYSRVKKVYKVWQASTRDILEQEDLVHDHLLPWVNDLERENDLIGAHAAWWAVENYVAQKQLADSECYFLTYEDLSMNPTEELTRLFSFLGAKGVKISQRMIREPSRLSGEKRKWESDALKRLGAWKNGFDEKSQFRILDWAHKFGLTFYNEYVLPSRDVFVSVGRRRESGGESLIKV